MKILDVQRRQDTVENSKLNKVYVQLDELLRELKKREMPDKIVESINQFVKDLNVTLQKGNELIATIKLKQTKIIKLVEKELKIVPKNYYRNIWLAVGMAVFGIPIGLMFGMGIGNIGLFGIGLPIGMLLGMAIGAGMDKKASEEGRQLDMEI